MKAVILDASGILPRYGDFAEPDLEHSETLIHVTAAAIKPIDRAVAAGTHYSSPRHFPVICGMDGTGTTEDGQRVYFTALRRPFGAMAERAPATWTVPIPSDLNDATAAAVVNPALAAWLPLLWRGRLVAGETVLILGATGAAGQAAVKTARLLGAGRVIAAGRRLDVLASLDADETIDLAQPVSELSRQFELAASRGIDLVVDYLWGPVTETLLGSIIKTDMGVSNSSREIRLVNVGEMAGSSIQLPGSVLRGSRIQLIGSGSANTPDVCEMQALVSDILARASSGVLSTEIECIDMANVREAWADTKPGHGRQVLMRSGC